jgi:hypothetical protein
MKLKKIIKILIKEIILEALAQSPRDPDSILNYQNIKKDAFVEYEESGDKEKDEKQEELENYKKLQRTKPKEVGDKPN